MTLRALILFLALVVTANAADPKIISVLYEKKFQMGYHFLMLHSDGRAEYQEGGTENNGTKWGTVSKKDVAFIHQSIFKAKFFSLQNRFFRGTMHGPEVAITVITTTSKKVVEDQDIAGPIRLLELEARLENLINKIKWKRTLTK